jgi:spore coat polysaccharide biosynthesis protein SpsF (cytidylyltransferase family)
MSTTAIIQARMSSTRLPGKVLAPLGDSHVLAWVIQAARQAQSVDEVVVATSTDLSDDRVHASPKG